MADSGDSDQQRYLDINAKSWDKIAKGTKGRTALPSYGPLCPDENELKLLGDVRGKCVIELGCGDGKSLHYLHEQGAEELHGLDLSPEQIKNATDLALEREFPASLYCAGMETDPGIPHDYFDIAISLYALGWSVDLEATLQHVANYLRSGGILVFSWEHPVFSCLKMHEDRMCMERSYSEVGASETLSWDGDPIVMHTRKISSFVNAVAGAGLVMDAMIEGDMREPSSTAADYPRRWYSQDRAKLMPTTLIIKAHKP
jgi:SAM-dependent methyltransferase